MLSGHGRMIKGGRAGALVSVSPRMPGASLMRDAGVPEDSGMGSGEDGCVMCVSYSGEKEGPLVKRYGDSPVFDDAAAAGMLDAIGGEMLDLWDDLKESGERNNLFGGHERE